MPVVDPSSRPSLQGRRQGVRNAPGGRWAAAIVLFVACHGDSSPVAFHDPTTGIDMVLVRAGTFVMGTPEDEPGHEDQEVQHAVRLSRAFYLARTEVTQAQWRSIMGTDPSQFRDCGPDCPVENVSWFDAREFAERLARRTGRPFRLPTEAEWEYACRAGTTTAFATGADLSTDQANYDGHYPLAGSPVGVYRERPTPVGSFPANSWGLFDMSGNVWEWTEDRHCPYPAGSVTDPLGDCQAPLQVIRGGSWYFNAESARCGLRYTHRPQDVGPSLGFRVACSLD